jgi:hypothetical protein
MSYKETCIKCIPADWQIGNLAGACPKCGLRMIKSSRKDGEKVGEWVEVRGNLDLAWYTGEIILPEKLEVHGDLNLTGCTKIRKDCLKSLIVHGNMFICNVREFVKLPEEKFQIGGRLFCKNTDFADCDKPVKEILEKKEAEDEWKFQKLRQKLPELEGVI